MFLDTLNAVGSPRSTARKEVRCVGRKKNIKILISLCSNRWNISITYAFRSWSQASDLAAYWAWDSHCFPRPHPRHLLLQACWHCPSNLYSLFPAAAAAAVEDCAAFVHVVWFLRLHLLWLLLPPAGHAHWPLHAAPAWQSPSWHCHRRRLRHRCQLKIVLQWINNIDFRVTMRWFCFSQFFSHNSYGVGGADT